MIKESFRERKNKILIQHHRAHFSYRTTIRHHLVTIGLVAAVFVVIALAVFHFTHPQNAFNISQVSAGVIFTATVNTFTRLLAAYGFALIVSIPFALFLVSTPLMTRIFLPIADVAQSVPVLAFFPLVIVFFTASHDFEAAAIFIIFIAMLWNIVFTVVGGLQTIPEDVEEAAFVFNVRGIQKFWSITLPAIFPFIVTGSLLAWAQGWTTVIVAEVLHTYIPGGMPSQDLLGMGSLLVDSNAAGDIGVFVVTLAVMILLISLINLFVWQRLLLYSRRFKFD